MYEILGYKPYLCSVFSAHQLDKLDNGLTYDVTVSVEKENCFGECPRGLPDELDLYGWRYLRVLARRTQPTSLSKVKV